MTPSEDFELADYSQAARSCDVVMKGGITSGVVYPHAVCELAQTYRFKNVGGTSAGAIAAAATAAAEYGRAGGGFETLAKLPDWLGRDTNLRDLFQPQAGTRRLYAVLLSSLEGGLRAMVRTTLRQYPFAAALGAAPALALTAVMLASAISSGSGALIAAAGVLTLVGLALIGAGVGLAAVLSIAREFNGAIADNGFGLCSGAAGEGVEGAVALTPWLTERLDNYAGLGDGGGPLTFGHLWAGPDGDRDAPPADPDDRHLQLAMMTTNLVNRRAHQLPWDDGSWLFKPSEFRKLFPEQVVRWMETHSPTNLPADGGAGERRSRLRLALAREQGLLALPAAADLPVVVATRMSLSFPILLSAVPLWQYDMTYEANKVAFGAWRQWAGQNEEDWDPLATEPSQWPTQGQPGAAEKPKAECCWFSDGGISSNFPVHFFDRLVPRWPTFAINLRPFALGRERDMDDEANNTWMVGSNRDGIADWWYRFPDVDSGWFGLKDARLRTFLGSAVRTMQNRADEAQMRVPGYRDRIAHVNMSDDEGGMNLTMDEARIKSLTKRGRAAAQRLIDAYTPPDPAGEAITWDNHRWVRFRSSLAVLEQMNVRFAEGYGKPPVGSDERTYAELLAAPPSYQLEGQWQHELAEREIRALEDVAAACDLNRSMAKDAPNPAPQGRITPRD